MLRSNDLLNELSAAQFVMWDLHLYLDTHTCDTEALKIYNKYKEKYKCLREEFEDKYWSLSPQDAEGVEWIKNPWPWENKECGC